MCRGQALPDPPARRAGNPTPMAAAVPLPITVQAVGIERPGLKPRAESASPLKGAVRRPGARVDRLGAGAVGISRLQPAWGVSPAVHGRAIEDTAARLICAACRARRVGHAESPRRWRGGRGSASPLHGVGGGSAVDPRPASVGRCSPSCRGQAVPDPPTRCGRQSHGAPIIPVTAKSCTWSTHATAICRAAGAVGEAAPRPYRGWVADQQWILDLPRLGGAASLCRGQAVPDPPTRCGRQTRPRSVWLPWSRDPHGDVRRRPCGHAARSGACRPQQGIPRPTRASASTDSVPVQTADRLAARGAAPAQRVATAGRTGSARTTSRRSYRPSGIHVRSVRVSRSVCRSTARSLCATVCTSTTR
jgi:hypothetical protein